MAIKTNHTSNKITAAQNDLVLDTDSPLHNVSVSDKRVVNVQDPVNAQDAVTKIYLETVVGAATGQANLLLGTPPDGSFTDGAYQQFDPNQTLTEAIDDLNEVMENVRNNTFVRSVDFTANITVGGAGLTTTLNIVPEGNANRYTIEWGDGSVTILIDLAEMTVDGMGGDTIIEGVKLDLWKDRVWHLIERVGILPEYKDIADDIEQMFTNDSWYDGHVEEEEIEEGEIENFIKELGFTSTDNGYA